MNQIYRVVFNAVTGAWQAVSEIARGRSKSSRSARHARAPLTSNALWCARQSGQVLVAVLLLCEGAAAADITLSTPGDSHDISTTGSETVDNFNGVAGTTL